MTKELKMIIEKDVAEIWRARMDSAFKEVGSGGGVGRAREEEKDRREKEARATFIVRRTFARLRILLTSLTGLSEQSRRGG